MAIGWQQLVIVLIIVLVLFGGRGRISNIMGDMAKGIRSFKKGLNEDDDAEAETSKPTAQVSHDATEPAEAQTAKADTGKKTEV